MSEGGASEWPFDPDGERGSRGMQRFDMAILSTFAPKSAFPMTAEEFLAEHGEKPVRMNYRTVVSVADLFEDVRVEEFESKTAFHRAIGDAIRAGDRWAFHVE
ncbi:MAG: DUF5785 family protein [Halodesulfurarchaeum sp.]